jgi:hypothetical protein
MSNGNRDEAGRFASTSSANPHSITPAQPFGRQANHSMSRGAQPGEVIDPAKKWGGKHSGKVAPAPKTQGFIPGGNWSIDVPAPKQQTEQRAPRELPEKPAAEDPNGPEQPAFEPQELPTGSQRMRVESGPVRPSLPGTSRLALPPVPSASEQPTPGSPIPPSVTQSIQLHGTPPSFGGITLGEQYTRRAHPKIIPGEVIE